MSRLRQRPQPLAASHSSTTTYLAVTLPSRPSSRVSHGRATRHAAIATYAEPPSDDDALGEDEDEDEDEDDSDDVDDDDVDDELGSDGSGDDDEDSDDSDGDEDSDSDDDDDDDDDDENDLDFGVGRRAATKRPRIDDARSLRSGPIKRRRLPRRRATTATAVAPPPPPPPPASSRKRSLASFVSNDHDQRRRRRTDKSADSRRGSKSKSKSKSQPSGRNNEKPPPPARKLLPWDALPYMVLVDILAYAAHPLDTVDAARWLVAACRTCRAFAEPGLRVLYEKPPLLSMNMAHSLLDMLTRKRMKPMFPYHYKIRALSIDVAVAFLSYKGRRLDLAALVAQCPRLAHLDLRHSSDGPPYRDLTTNHVSSPYTVALFEALGAKLPEGETKSVMMTLTSSNRMNVSEPAPAAHPHPHPVATRLESWRWNFRMFGPGWTADVMRFVHQLPTFARLRKVTLVNFWQKSSEASVAGALAALPCLQHLVMEQCAMLDEDLLELLPRDLEHLELISCNSVRATPFAAFLVTHGQQLRSLTLHHNRSLSLEFLTVLGTACPRLEALRMNLTYYSPLHFSSNPLPNYDQLFTAAQVPSWPASMGVIQLENLRKWEADAAEMFFQSLVDSAARMPHLRVLVIKAMLNIPWRQRSEMRDRWVATLDQVFKRPWTPPAPAHSLAYYVGVGGKSSHGNDDKQPAEPPAPRRRSTRIPKMTPTTTPGPSLTSRLDRIASRHRRSYREPDTDDDEFASSSSSEEEEEDSDDVALCKTFAARRGRAGNNNTSNAPTPTPALVHGMCDVVNIMFDNQKPVEVQYTMEDFEDSEPDTGDDDWTE